MNDYQILGLTIRATEAEIKSAYKKMALKYHPDINKSPDATKQFITIKAAYERLIYKPKLPQRPNIVWQAQWSSGTASSFSQTIHSTIIHIRFY